MNDRFQHEGLDTLPWFRQFWPWFIIALPSTAVIAGFATLWIAISAAPERIDHFGDIAIPVEVAADRTKLTFDLGPSANAPWPAFLNVLLVPRAEGDTQRLLARRFDGHFYEAPVATLTPGTHEVIITDDETTLRLRGNWAYPAPVWKLRVDD